MKAVLNLPGDLASWFAGNVEPEVVRASAFALINSSIIQCEKDRETLAHQVDFSKLPNAQAQYLEAILQKSIFNIEHSPKFADHRVPDNRGHNHIELSLANDLNSKATIRSDVYKKDSETKEILYERTVGVLARLAKRIVILDPYAGTALMDDRRDRLWLIRRLVESGCANLHIVTTVPDLDNKKYANLSEQQRKQRIIKAIEVLAKETHSDISSEIYIPNKAKFHNRRLKFEFEGGVLGCLLEKGIDGFAGKAIEAGSAVKPLKAEEVREAIMGLAELKRITT